MTKTERILALYDGKRTTREIADIVGCGPSYVRVVARQRRDLPRRKFTSTHLQALSRAARKSVQSYRERMGLPSPEQVLNLKRQGLSFREMAQILEITEGQVRGIYYEHCGRL